MNEAAVTRHNGNNGHVEPECITIDRELIDSALGDVRFQQRAKFGFKQN